MARSYWMNFNYNPWKAYVGDCAIRAVVAATGLDYREVCKRLHVSYARGKGLRRDTGIDLDQIEKTFSEYFDIVEDFYDNFDFVPDEMKGSAEDDALRAFDLDNSMDSVTGTTLHEFCQEFSGQGTFLVSLAANKEADGPAGKPGAGHIVCAKLSPRIKRQGFIDTWDSSMMLVDAYMRVVKKEPYDSPLHWKWDDKAHKFIV